MASQKKVMKILVMIIIVVFLLSSGLVSVMYFSDMSGSEPVDVVSDGVLTDIVNDTNEETLPLDSIDNN